VRVSYPNTIPRPRPTRRQILTAILLVAALARVLVVLLDPHYVPTNDAADYDHAAVSLATHGTYPPSGVGGPAALRPPAFPYLLAAVDKVVGVSSATMRWDAGRVAQVVLGVIAVALIYLIARRLWDERVALLAAGLAAVYPPLLLAGSSLMTEPLYIVFTLGAVLAALSWRSTPPGRLRYAVLAGVLCGLSALTRGNGIFFVIPLLLLVWDRRPRFSRRALIPPVVVALATVVAIAPWAVRNTIEFGEFVPLGTETGYALSGTYNNTARLDHHDPALWRPLLAPILALHREHPRWNEAQISNRLISQTVHFAGQHPGYVLEVVYWSALRMLNLTGPGLERTIAPVWDYPRGLAVASVYAFWLCGLLVLVGAFSRTARRAPPPFWLIPLALVGPSLFFLGLTRYRVPADPFVLMIAALGVRALARRSLTDPGQIGGSSHPQPPLSPALSSNP
jgi:4-amino-4-deoxy-L-arabinose transferase-like glycosyltransferase